MKIVPADVDFEPESAATPEQREHNRQLQFLSDNFPDGVVYQYTITADGRRLLTYLGRGAEKIFGERPPHIPANVEWLTARILPEDEPGIARAAEESRRDLTQFNHDVRVRARDGSERWVSFRTQPRELSDGTVVWDGVILDITAKRRAEESMRRQVGFLEQLNQATLELMACRKVHALLPVLIARTAKLLNSPHAEISLLEGDELVVRSWSNGESLPVKHIGRDTPTPAWRAIETRTAVVTERSAGVEDNFESARASGIQAMAIFPMVRGAECMGVLGVAREEPGARYTPDDVHEGMFLTRMAAFVLNNAAAHEEAARDTEVCAAALRESEQRFRGVFDRSPVAVGLFSVPGGRIVDLNIAALAAFGVTREEAIGRSSFETSLWVDRTLRDRCLQRLRAEGSVRPFEAEMRRKNGATFTVLYSSTLVTIGGQPFSLATMQETTARMHERFSPLASRESAAPIAPTPEIPRGNGERILVVDDNPVSGLAIEKVVESLGYNVSRYTRPEDALAHFTAAPSSFDLVLTDLAMPGMDGQELLQHLLRVRPDLPVVVVSGYVDAERHILLEQTGARAVLRKPVSRAGLGCTVAQHVRESR